MAATDPNGAEICWIDGAPFPGVRVHSTNTGSQKYWVDGGPVDTLFPKDNQDTGKFFLLFE